MPGSLHIGVIICNSTTLEVVFAYNKDSKTFCLFPASADSANCSLSALKVAHTFKWHDIEVGTKGSRIRTDSLRGISIRRLIAKWRVLHQIIKEHLVGEYLIYGFNGLKKIHTHHNQCHAKAMQIKRHLTNNSLSLHLKHLGSYYF